MSANQVSDEILEDYVKKGLEKWRTGDLFMTVGISENDVILEPGSNIPDDDHKSHPYNKFLRSVAESVAEDFALGTKEKKRYVKQLKSKSKRWQALIMPRCEEIANKTASSSSSKKTNTGKKSANKPKEKPIEDPPEAQPAELVEHFDNEVPPTTKPRFEKHLEEKRKNFEHARDLILNDVPEDAKARFGQVFFSKWGKQTLPALVMSPYSVPPGIVRDQWLSMFDNLKSSGRLNAISNLVYWYGSSTDPWNAYSFVPTSKLIRYETGLKKNLDKISPPVQKKLDQGQPLSGNMKQFVEGLKEMKEDLGKNPKDRSGWMGTDFIEAYAITTDEEDEAPSNEPPIAKKKTKSGKSEKAGKLKKVGGKRKKKNEEDEESPLPSKKAKPGPKKKKMKREAESTSAIGSFFTASNTAEDEGPVIKKEESSVKMEDTPVDRVVDSKMGEDVASGPTKVEPESQAAAEVTSVPVKTDSQSATDAALVPIKKEPDKLDQDEEYRFAMEESESEDDKDDEDFDGGFGAVTDGKEEDLPLGIVEGVSSRKSEGKRSGKTEKEAPKKKGAKTKKKVEKKTLKSKKEPSEKEKLKQAQRNYAKSEEKIDPLLKRWQASLDAKDEDGIIKLCDEMLPLVDDVHWALMPVVMKKYVKPSKNILTQKKKKFKSLWEALKTHYAEVNQYAIPGFVPDPALSKVEAKTERNLKATAETEPTPSNEMIDPGAVKEDPHKSFLASSIKRVGSLEKVGEKTESEPAPQKDTKVERKKFSLGKLMRPSSDASKGSAKSSTTDKSVSAKQSMQKKQTIPDWVTGVSQCQSPPDGLRALGAEFLRQAAPFIPTGKGVDHNAIALALEASIYKLVTTNGQFNWSKRYWEKVDDIVVALSGEKEPGTIASMVAQGKFESSDQVAQLSDDAIMNSFLGKPVMPP